MRSNRIYSIREHFSAVRKFLITKLSLLFLRLAPDSNLIVVRDGGLGDAVMATVLVEKLKNRYSMSEISLSTSFPEIFESVRIREHSFFSFPVIWLSYTHYDFFPWILRKPLHCSAIMAELVGTRFDFNIKPKLSLNENKNAKFIQDFIMGKKYFLIQPFAGEWFKSKNWSIDCWEELASELKKEGNLVYLIGTSENPEIEGTLDFRGKTTIEQSFLLVKYASVLIGVNSFAEQVAWAFNVPSVILYGPTNPLYSLNPRQVAVTSKNIIGYEELSSFDYSFSDMEAISTKTVLEAVEQIQREY